MISYRSLCAVPYFLLLLAAISFGASTANGKDAFLASQDSALSPPVESGSWLNSFWSNFGTKIQEGWNQFANGTSHTYQKAVSGIKETWDRVANQTSPTFSQVSTKLQDGWGGFANETVNTFSKVSTKFQDGWEAVANGTVSTYHTATSRLCFVFANLFCPSNKTENVTTITVPQETVEVKTLDSSPQYDDAEAIQTFSCTALKYLTVLGISLAGGLAVTLVLPVIFYLVLFALGFTGYGVALGSSAAFCQSKMGNVVGGSWFSFCQSMGHLGLVSLYYWPFLLAIWTLSCPLIGYFIWPLF